MTNNFLDPGIVTKMSRQDFNDYVSVDLATAILKPRYIPLCFLPRSFLRYSSYFFGSQYFQCSL